MSNYAVLNRCKLRVDCSLVLVAVWLQGSHHTSFLITTVRRLEHSASITCLQHTCHALDPICRLEFAVSYLHSFSFTITAPRHQRTAACARTDAHSCGLHFHPMNVSPRVPSIGHHACLYGVCVYIYIYIHIDMYN